MTKKKLIEEAKKSPAAFEKLFEKYYAPILHYILKRTGNVQIAEDITSQVFFTVVKKLWQFQWRNIPFSAWLYRIAQNEIHYFFRKKRYSTISLEALLESDAWEPDDEYRFEEELKDAEKKLSDHQEFLSIQKRILTLPDKYQEVLTLKYFENKKNSEIALIIGKKENTVKSLLRRGLKLLQTKMHPFSTSIISEDEQL